MRIANLLGTAALAAAAFAVPASTAHAGAVATCTNAELRASYHVTDAGMGHRFGELVLRNISDHSCRTGGFGGLSYVGGGNGTQIGAPADRHGSAARTLVVRPGQEIVSAVEEANASAYPKRACRPTHVDGFRVYVPNATASQFVAHPTTGCSAGDVHLLEHGAFAR